ncbi:hypothetical protein RSAG8_07518, partial [Rhizoctonia solani AG-8 WAC10335]
MLLMLSFAFQSIVNTCVLDRSMPDSTSTCGLDSKCKLNTLRLSVLSQVPPLLSNSRSRKVILLAIEFKPCVAHTWSLVKIAISGGACFDLATPECSRVLLLTEPYSEDRFRAHRFGPIGLDAVRIMGITLRYMRAHVWLPNPRSLIPAIVCLFPCFRMYQARWP